MTIVVEVGVAMLDNVGATVCVITTERNVQYRGLCVHRRLVTEKPPVYLQEAAVLHGLRALHSWPMATTSARKPPMNIHMRAGFCDAI